MLCYEVFKKWPLLSLFPGCIRKILPFFSLNNNFGTLNSCSGLFPFRHTTLSYYVRQFNINHYPSESKFSLIKSSRSPNVYKLIIYFDIRRNTLLKFIWDHNSVPAMMLFELPTYIGFAENQLSWSVLSFTNLPQFFGYLYNDNPFGLL